MANTAAMEASGIEEVTKLATEAISNIRTVASLSKLNYHNQDFCDFNSQSNYILYSKDKNLIFWRDIVLR